MSSADNYWSVWAPYWDMLGDRHYTVAATKANQEYMQSPVLVVGAGYGIIVNYLRTQGITCDGIDLNQDMLKKAKDMYDIDLIYANANNMPFEDASYGAVILSSGVLDYTTDPDQTRKMIDEAMRVLKPGGHAFFAYYQVEDVFLPFLKGLGIIRDNKYYMKRLFRLNDFGKINMHKVIKEVCSWNDKPYCYNLFYFLKLGVTLPKEVKEDGKLMKSIFAKAEKDGISKQILIDNTPDEVPYRDFNDLSDLFGKIDFQYTDYKRFNDCLVFHKAK